MMTMTAHKDEKPLDECRQTLDRVIEARAREDWSLESQLQKLRESAVLGAIDEGFPIESVSEASGASIEEIRKMLDSR